MELWEYFIEQRVNLFLKQMSHNYFRRTCVGKADI